MKCDDCEFVRETVEKDILKILQKNTPHMVEGIDAGMVYCGHYHSYIVPKRSCAWYVPEVEEEEDW